MKRSTGIVSQAVLWGAGAVALLGDAIPPSGEGYLLGGLAGLSVLVSVLTSNRNPDGTSAATPYVRRTKDERKRYLYG
jgi:hypothetical protein